MGTPDASLACICVETVENTPTAERTCATIQPWTVRGHMRNSRAVGTRIVPAR